MIPPGILTSCSWTPGTGFVVHRGTGVNPVISHLPRRVAAPPCAWRDILALHKEGVGGKHRAIAHRHAVVDEGPHSDRTARADRGAVALEGAILLGVALDLAPEIEDALVPQRGEGRLRDVGAVVEHPFPDPDAGEPPEQVLERGTVKRVEIVDRMHLPDALDGPEIRVVDRADRRLHRV